MHAEWVEIGYDDRVEPDDLVSHRDGRDTWYSVRWCAPELINQVYREVMDKFNVYVLRARLAAVEEVGDERKGT